METELAFWLVDEPGLLDELRQHYYASLTGPVEPWLEEQTHRASYFAIRHGAEMVGYACIDCKDRLLQFYLDDAFAPQAQSLFLKLIDERFMRRAYVSTRDPFVLSLCMDCQTGTACQAYLFVDRAMVDCPIREIEEPVFRPAVPADLAAVTAVCDDFFMPTEANIDRGKLFLLYGGGALLSVGLIETADCYPPTTASIGMFTNADFRQRGAGAHMIMRLKERCYATGYTPIAGCWYYNEASKRTLERAGMVTKDRMLDIRFTST